MCDPVTGTVTTMSIMGWGSAAAAGAGVMQQQQAANSTNASNQTQYANALLARAQNANQVNLGRQQAGDQAGQKQQENNLAQREAQATQVARAGPSGLSVDALLADLGRKGGTYNQ
jgi:hypothetical protein